MRATFFLSRLGLLLIGAILLARPASALCDEDMYEESGSGACVTREQCEAKGKQIREGDVCRLVVEVSTVEGLKALGKYPYRYAACVLTADITFDEPTGPIEFYGELDGQGHWIKNINLKLRTFVAARSDEVSLSLFPSVAIIKNVGFEAAIDITNGIKELSSVDVSLVNGGFPFQQMHDVVFNGSISVQNGTHPVFRVSMGCVFGGFYKRFAVLGPNITSHCDFSCRASQCKIGGLAFRWNDVITGVAVAGSSITAEANEVSLGGVVLSLGAEELSRSSADLKKITIIGGSSSVKIGGLVGLCGKGVISDSYALVSDVNITRSADQASSSTIYFSPFIAGASNLQLKRCYAWLKNPVSLHDADNIYVGGLVGGESKGYPVTAYDLISISHSFSILEGLSLKGKNIWAGGLLGQAKTFITHKIKVLNITDSWTKFALDQALLYDSGASHIGAIVSLDGYINYCFVNLTNVAVMLISRGSGDIGALVGSSLINGNISKVLVEYTCSRGNCTSIHLFSSNLSEAVTFSDVYVVEHGGKIVERRPKKVTFTSLKKVTFTSLTGKYDSTFYSGLSEWDFHENAYPTLSSLPVFARGGRRIFSNPTASTWPADVWMLPNVSDNHPRFTGSGLDESAADDAFCVSCPGSTVLQCESYRSADKNGFSCQPCATRASPNSEPWGCVQASACLDYASQECDAGTQYLKCNPVRVLNEWAAAKNCSAASECGNCMLEAEADQPLGSSAGLCIILPCDSIEECAATTGNGFDE